MEKCSQSYFSAQFGVFFDISEVVLSAQVAVVSAQGSLCPRLWPRYVAQEALLSLVQVIDDVVVVVVPVVVDVLVLQELGSEKQRRLILF